MLTYVYMTNSPWSHSATLSDLFGLPYKYLLSTAALELSVALYHVADKYNCPALMDGIHDAFDGEFLFGLPKSTPQEFSNIVKHVYELPRAGIKHPLVKTILHATDLTSRVHICNTEGQRLERLLKAFEETAEFGRDFFIHMTSKCGVKFDSESGSRRITEIGIMVMVECPHRGDIWFRREGYTVDGHCKGCGEYVENWMDFEQVSGDLKKP
jgi:hypothetical protein